MEDEKRICNKKCCCKRPEPMAFLAFFLFELVWGASISLISQHANHQDKYPIPGPHILQDHVGVTVESFHTRQNLAVVTAVDKHLQKRGTMFFGMLQKSDLFSPQQMVKYNVKLVVWVWLGSLFTPHLPVNSCVVKAKKRIDDSSCFIN